MCIRDRNKVCDLVAESGVFRFPSISACDNDEARSLYLSQVAVGTVVEVYDNPDCRTNDDWTSIRVNTSTARTLLGSFEISSGSLSAPDQLDVTYNRDNGLDGKVSCVRIVAP